MINVKSALSNFWGELTGVIGTFWVQDIIDVLVVAYLVYHAVRLVRETRAMQLVKGIAAILVLYFFATQLNMITLRFLITNILQVGLLALVMLFQPEIRRALEQMGRTNITRFSRFGSGQTMDAMERKKTEELIGILCDSCAYLAERKTGALIVVERQIKLGEIIKTGTTIDSEPSVELIGNIFFTNSPLHDGAMIIRQHRLYAAGCYLPLSQNMEIGRELGTRHRAALGMSEVSDALILVVSEETGAISVAMDSRLQRKLSVQNLKKLLQAKLLGNKPAEEAPPKTGFWRLKK